MTINHADFYSLRNIRDNSLLLAIAHEYLAENVYLVKFGKELKKSLADLKDDIKFLKKEFPGKFASEVNTDVILSSFDKTVEGILTGSETVLSDCKTGILGVTLFTDIKKITEAIEKIWNQVKGSDVHYTKADQVTGFLGRLNLFSGAVKLISGVFRVILLLFIIIAAGFSFLFFTMEKETSIVKENKKHMIFIQEKKTALKGLEQTKIEVQTRLKSISSNLLRTDKIAILDLETKIQVCNNDINIIDGQIETINRQIDKNNERIEKIRAKSFMDRLFRR
jgi:hypothetical protein